MILVFSNANHHPGTDKIKTMAEEDLNLGLYCVAVRCANMELPHFLGFSRYLCNSWRTFM
jgi:hypothetical protein